MSEMTFPDDLLEGYRSFRTGTLSEQRARYEALAAQGQKPQTMIIACCDSRAAPEIVFNAGPGELFVLRNVANLVPPYAPDGAHHATSAALEFAVQALRVKNIVVMGHGRCGGISAALAGDEMTPLSPGDFIGRWMDLLNAPAASIATVGHMTAAERQRALERIAIRYSIANLRTFPCINILEQKGKLHLHGAWFDISSGELWTMNADGDFRQAR